MGDAVAIERGGEGCVQDGEALGNGRNAEAEAAGNVLFPRGAKSGRGVGSICGIDGRDAIAYAILAGLRDVLFIGMAVGRSWVRGNGVGTEERVGKGAVGWLVVGVGVHAGTQGDGRGTDRDTAFAIVDTAAVGQHVDVGTLGTEFAVTL